MRRAARRGSSGDDEVDVLVGVGAAEQAVAHGAADDPRALVAQRLADRLDHASGTPSRWYTRADAPAEAAGDLVVDRVKAPRPLLGEDPLAALPADQDRLVAAVRVRLPRGELDRHVVHAHRPDAAAGAARRRGRRRCS